MTSNKNQKYSDQELLNLVFSLGLNEDSIEYGLSENVNKAMILKARKLVESQSRNQDY